MPYDHDSGFCAGRRPPPQRASLREGALELMLRVQVGAGFDESALRAELRRLVAARHDRVAALWAAYSGDRTLGAAPPGAPHRQVAAWSHAALTVE